MSNVVEQMIQDAINGSRETEVAIGDQELQFEVWFNYFLTRVGERTLFNKATVYDDLTFNMDGYEPTRFPVVNQMLKGMSAIGMDFIKPSIIGPLPEELEETFGSMIVDDMEDLYWVIFTIVEHGHPLKGVRYATAYRNGELIYPPQDPAFTESYPDEDCHQMARGIFIDRKERFIRMIRPELYKTDERGALLP